MESLFRTSKNLTENQISLSRQSHTCRCIHAKYQPKFSWKRCNPRTLHGSRHVIFGLKSIWRWIFRYFVKSIKKFGKKPNTIWFIIHVTWEGIVKSVSYGEAHSTPRQEIWQESRSKFRNWKFMVSTFEPVASYTVHTFEEYPPRNNQSCTTWGWASNKRKISKEAFSAVSCWMVTGNKGIKWLQGLRETKALHQSIEIPYNCENVFRMLQKCHSSAQTVWQHLI